VTADRRLQAGGWAALLVAILLPLEFVAARLWPATSDDAVIGTQLALSTALLLCTLAAVVGLDGWFRALAPGQATRVLLVGVIGVALALGLSAGPVLAIAGFTGLTASTLPTFVWLLALSSLLIGLWFFLGGAIVMAGGGGLVRIGWSGMIGGAAMILAAFAVATRFGSSTAGGPDELSLRDWFHLIGLFVVLYLIRTWRYVVGGRLPAPGIL
jgi:hypothetical protein